MFPPLLEAVPYPVIDTVNRRSPFATVRAIQSSSFKMTNRLTPKSFQMEKVDDGLMIGNEGRRN
uniref:Uncharacterized protein n=1 Tax=Arundo donax TaxID=35708 RepID=A0A0A9BXK4_ARUDO